jgi:predicted esterase
MLFLASAGVGFAQKPVGKGFGILPDGVEVITVKTRSPENKEVPYYLRVPKGFQPGARGKAYRLLFLCPFFNGDGLRLIRDCQNWQQIADQRQWFIMTCTFKQNGAEVQDRRTSYYYPEGFSGKATLEALAQVAKKYPVDTERLFLHGFSGGAQFVHRFAMWAPERVTAVAVNSASWFDAPGAKCNQVAWLVTVGESDDAYNNSLELVDRLRAVGAAPLFRSYIGMLHESSGKAGDLLNQAFFRFYDDLTGKDLGKKRTALTPMEERLAMKGEKMPCVGDSQDWKFGKNTADSRENIAEDSRIFLPSEEIAKIWGQHEAKEE